jgi:hypothetical protein
VLSAPENLRYSQLAAASVCFSVDNDLVRPLRGASAHRRIGASAPRSGCLGRSARRVSRKP